MFTRASRNRRQPVLAPARRDRFDLGRRIVRATAELVARSLTTLSPRDDRRWVFGSRVDEFVDNPAYLFDHVHKFRPDIHATWLTGDREVVARLRAAGLPAALRWSLAGARAALRAGVNVYAADARDSNYALTGGAVGVNLYHGLPLKQIEFAITTGPATRVYHPSSIRDRVRSRVMYAPKWSRHDVVVVPSDWAEREFARAFDGRVRRWVRALPPRTAPFVQSDPELPGAFDRERRMIGELMVDDTEFLLYLPTWRRGKGFDPTAALPDPSALDVALAARGLRLAIKAHPYDRFDFPMTDRIRVITDEVDVTALLSRAAALITDYSSAMFDAALLGKPVIFVPYDHAAYVADESDGFTLDYERLVGDRAVHTPANLLEVIEDETWRKWNLDAALVGRVWDRSLVAGAAGGNDRIVDAACSGRA